MQVTTAIVPQTHHPQDTPQLTMLQQAIPTPSSQTHHESALTVIDNLSNPPRQLFAFHPSFPFFYRRFLSAALLLPTIYLCGPILVTVTLDVISMLSYGHQYLTITLSSLITLYIRRLIRLYAPDDKSRDEALKSCARKLPLMVVFVCVMAIRLFYRYFIGGGSAVTGGVSLFTGVFLGVKLAVSGFVLSVAVMCRYVGPFAVVRCSNTLLFTNPYENLFQSILPSLDYFLQNCRFPSALGVNYLNPTLHQILFQFFFHLMLGVVLGIVNLLLYNSDSSMVLISTIIIMFYSWINVFILNNGLEISVDKYSSLGSQWYLHIWKEGSIKDSLIKQMKHLVLSISSCCLLHCLSTYGLKAFLGVLLKSLPTLLIMISLSCFHIIVTDVLIRSFLSQNINWDQLSMSETIQSLVFYPREVLTKVNALHSNERSEMTTHKKTVDEISKQFLQTKMPPLSKTLLQAILLKSLPTNEAKKINTAVTLYILRYEAIYISCFAASLHTLPTTAPSHFPTSTIVFLHYTIQSFAIFLSRQKRHSQCFLIIPTLLYSLYKLHEGILAYGKKFSVGIGNRDVRMDIALMLPRLGVLLRELESIALELEDMRRSEEISSILMEREVEVWVESLKRRDS